MYKKLLLILIIVTLVGCKAAKPVIITTKKSPIKRNSEIVHTTKKPIQTKSSKQEYSTQTTEVIASTSKTVVSSDVVVNYISEFKDIAMENMRIYGIPASIVLAQGILESGAGRGDLAIYGNNHFGIKCHEGWTGDTIKHDDDSAQECFRKYGKPAESFKDHALFLTGRSRYSNLFSLSKDDYIGWARGLRSAGYATDPKYPNKLISYIERYNLEQYDNQVLGKESIAMEKQLTVERPLEMIKTTTRDIAFYEVQKGDTLYSISKRFNLMVEELKNKNNIFGNTLSIGQKLKIK